MPHAPATRPPLFWAALAFAAGIIAGVYLWRPPLWWLVAAAVLMLAAVWFRTRDGWRNFFAYMSAFAALLALGAWVVQARDAAFELPDLSRFTDGNEVVVTAHVTHDGILRGRGVGQQSVDLETEEISRDGVAAPIAAGVRMTIYGRGEWDYPAAPPAVPVYTSARARPPRHVHAQRPQNRDARGAPMAARAGESGATSGALKLPDSLGLHVLTCGQRVQFPVKLRAPRNFQNPGAWDYCGYLRKQGIVAQGTVAVGKVEVLPGTVGSRFARWSSRARRAIIARIHVLWPRPRESQIELADSVHAGLPESSPYDKQIRYDARKADDQAALFDAMLIGERSLIGRDTNAAWQRTGIYHILVVSGMNIGILAVVIFAMLRRLRAGAGWATLLTIALAAGYAWLAELGAPVLRSVLMLTVFLLTRLLYRDRSLLNAIGAAALVLLVTDPRSLFDASFQLTFLAVAAIAGLAVPILERTSQPYRHGLQWLFLPAFDVALPPRVVQLRLDLRLLAQRLARLLPVRPERGQASVGWMLRAVLSLLVNVYEVIVVSASAQLAMTLPMVFYFHRATLVGLAANTLAVPLTGVLMMAAALALALAFLWLPLAYIPAAIAAWSLTAITTVVRVLGSLRVADVRLPAPSPLQVLVAAIALAAAMLLVRRRAVLAVGGLAALLASGIWITAFPPPPQIRPGVLEITAIDVGQAESTLIVTPRGRTLLVDAAGSLGPFHSDFDFGEDVIAPYLWSRDIRRIDALVLTHAHSDHMGGMPGVIANLHPHELWLGPNAQTWKLRRLLRIARKAGVVVVPRCARQQFDFGGARFEVLSPPPDWEVKDKPRNNDSLVLRVSLGATSALLTADAEKKIERYLVLLNPHATLLEVGHNGSNTSTTPEFLEAVHPRFAFISVGAHNSFHHPRPEVLQRLAQAHVATYRTDMLGAVTFLLDGKTVVPKPEVLP